MSKEEILMASTHAQLLNAENPSFFLKIDGKTSLPKAQHN